MADSTAAAAAPAAAPQAARPPKPDQEVYDKEVAQAEKEYKEALERYVSPRSLVRVRGSPFYPLFALIHPISSESLGVHRNATPTAAV